METRLAGDYRRKIKTVDELCSVLGPRPRKHTVVMCHGVFDLVHPGHIRHLRLCQGEGRHPDREPHGGCPYHKS